jgi:hypothetical protein
MVAALLDIGEIEAVIPLGMVVAVEAAEELYHDIDPVVPDVILVVVTMKVELSESPALIATT